MKNYIKYELRKLVTGKIFYICLIIAVASILIEVLAQYAVISLSVSMEESVPTEYLYVSLSANGLVSNCLTSLNAGILFSIFCSIFICNDFGDGVLRNVIGRGTTRAEIFFGKYIVCLIFALITYFLSITVSFLLGLAIGGIGEGWNTIGPVLICQILIVVSYVSVTFFLAFLFKKTGLAIALSIVITTFLTSILTVLDFVIFVDELVLSKYWLDGLMMEVGQGGISVETLIKIIIGFVCYTGASLGLGYLSFFKKEV